MITTLPLLIFLVTFLLGIAAIPLYIRVARSRNIIDVPNARSSHSVPTPRGGGIFIPIGIITTCIFAFTAIESHPSTIILTITLSLVGIIGFIDDIKSLPSTLRLAAHLTCGTAVAFSTLPQVHFVFAAITIGLSTIWLVGCLNIFNFMDGIDGIATCQGIVAASVWFVIAQNTGNALGSLLTLASLGGLLAFLIFNWQPAKVFMGDSSSGTLGFLFGALPLLTASSDLQNLWIHINYGALALFPFLCDGTYTLFRRLVRRENVLEAHRSHLYQRWNQSGKSHRFVTSAYALWAILCGSACLLAFFTLIPLWASWILAGIPAAILLNLSRCFSSD